MPRRASIAFVVAGCLAVACEATAEERKKADHAAPDYPVAGVVVSVNPSKGTLVIRGYNLLGSLRLKSGEYRAASRFVLTNLRPGDRVAGTYSAKDGRIHRLRKIAKGASSRRL